MKANSMCVAMRKDRLRRSIVFRGFYKTLTTEFGDDLAEKIWEEANRNLVELEQRFPDVDTDSRMMILPAAALYQAIKQTAPKRALPLIKAYGEQIGKKIAGVIHAMTSIPGLSRLLWKNMPKLMRRMSGPEKGYTRKIVSETRDFVGVDILSCPLHDTALKIGVPEAALVVCTMDKAYMTGFKYIEYTRTTSVAEGAVCCDYRLRFDKNKR